MTGSFVLIFSRYMAKHQGIWDDWVSFYAMVWTPNIQPPYLDSVSRSPLYSIYGETIAGVTIIRAFGASSKFLRDMLRCVDTVCHFFPYTYQFICSITGQNTNPYYWMWACMYTTKYLEYFVDSPSFVVNRWLEVRFNLLSAAVVGVTALVCLVTPSISASTAGLTLAFASTITHDLLFLVCFVGDSHFQSLTCF